MEKNEATFVYRSNMTADIKIRQRSVDELKIPAKKY